MDLTSNNTHTIDTETKTPPPTQPTKTNTPKSLSFTTVTLKRPPHLHPTTTAAAATTTTMVAGSYKECLKNHAANIGGHALDGCGEFMASSSTNLTDPRSLKCAACGCHRNFHRRDPPEPSTTTTTNNNHNKSNPTFPNCFYSPPPPPSAAVATAPPPPPPQPLPHRAMSQSTSPSLSSSPSHGPSPMSSPSSPPPLSHVPPSYHHHHHHHQSSAPHMLLALGNAYSAVALPSSDNEHHQHIRNSYLNNNSSMVVKGLENPMNGGNKKRYRTKFSQEQKEKMYSFSERLGWRMQKGDDGLVQEFCNDIGVPRGVFKVWMHNHKNTFKKRSSELVGNAPNQNNIIDEKVNNNGDVDDDDDDDHDDDGNHGNNRGGGGVGVGAGGFDSDINNPYNTTNGSNNSDIHRSDDGCVNVHVPINGLSS